MADNSQDHDGASEPDLAARPSLLWPVLSVLAAIVLVAGAGLLHGLHGIPIRAVAYYCTMSIGFSALFVFLVGLCMWGGQFLGQPSIEIRSALWGLTSGDLDASVRSVKRLALRGKGQARRWVGALRGEGVAVADEVDKALGETRAPENSLWAMLTRYRWQGVFTVLCCAAVEIVATAAEPQTRRGLDYVGLVTVSLLAAVVLAVFSAFVCIKVVFVVAYTIYQRHHERELIWQLNSSDPGEKIDAARKLAIWGRKTALDELFEAMHDDDPAVAAAARRAYVILNLMRPGREGRIGTTDRQR